MTGLELYDSFIKAQEKGFEFDWIVKNKKRKFLIELDNDVTYISFEDMPEDHDGFVNLRNTLGNMIGVYGLLEALGIECGGAY